MAAPRWVSWATAAGDVTWPDGGHQGRAPAGRRGTSSPSRGGADPAIVSGQHATFPDILFTGAMPAFTSVRPREHGGVCRAGHVRWRHRSVRRGSSCGRPCQRERMGYTLNVPRPLHWRPRPPWTAASPTLRCWPVLRLRPARAACGQFHTVCTRSTSGFHSRALSCSGARREATVARKRWRMPAAADVP